MTLSLGILFCLLFFLFHEIQGGELNEFVVPIEDFLHMGEVETVGIVVGNRLVEKGLDLSLGRFGRGGVFPFESLVYGKRVVMRL